MKFCNPKTPFTRYNLLSNQFDNRLDNRLYHVHKHPIGCQTGRTTGCSTVQQPVGQPAASCKHIQPVVKPFVQPVWQPVVSCKRSITLTSDQPYLHISCKRWRRGAHTKEVKRQTCGRESKRSTAVANRDIYFELHCKRKNRICTELYDFPRDFVGKGVLKVLRGVLSKWCLLF